VPSALIGAFALVAIAAWIVAVVAAVRLLGHRLPGRGVGWYLVRGYAFFDSAAFLPSGRGAQRALVLSSLVFLGVIVAVFVVAVASV
jgi:hypothetical protein